MAYNMGHIIWHIFYVRYYIVDIKWFTYESDTKKIATTSWFFVNVFPDEKCHSVEISFLALKKIARKVTSGPVIQPEVNAKAIKAFLIVSFRKSPVTKSSSVVWIAFHEFFKHFNSLRIEIFDSKPKLHFEVI